MRSWIRHSFRNQIFVTVLLVTLVPVLLCSVLMLQVQVSRISNDQNGQAQQQLDTLEASFTDLLEKIDTVSRDLSESTVVRSVLRNETADSSTLYQVLSRDTAPLRGLTRFDLCFASGECLYTTDPMRAPQRYDPDWGILQSAAESDALVYRAGEDSGGAVEMARAVRSYDGNVLGYVVAVISRENFNDLFCNTLARSSDVMIVDRFWDPVYFSRNASTFDTVQALRTQMLAGDPLSDPGGECSYVVREEPGTGFFLILQQPRAFTDQVLEIFYQVSAAMALLSLVLSLCYALHFSRYLSAPVHQLSEAMGQVQKGNLSVQISMDREDELGRLSHSFNRMTREYQANLERSVERQKQLNTTQIRMMQAQLNPHFLYNTLDSIKWLGVAHGVPEISSMATDLAAILRDSISGEAFVTLEQELEIIDRYLEIQYIRFEDRFVCEVDIPEKFQHCLIPKLSLQPLVENAIIHGVADQEEGYIKITAWEEGRDLILCVADNGCGIPQEILDALNDPGRQIPGRHLGLSNVDQIARLHFGEGYGVFAESAAGAGSRVCLKIPMKKEEKIHAEDSDC